MLSGLKAAIKGAHNQPKSLKGNKTKPEGHNVELDDSYFNNSTGMRPLMLLYVTLVMKEDHHKVLKASYSPVILKSSCGRTND